MKKITVLGNNSGRNAGDAAILGNLLHDIATLRKDIKFLVPTTNPAFIYKHFGQYNIKAVGLLPWFGAIKNFGIPMLKAMLQADMVLITDNILFDKSFYNPIFNNLLSISLYAPLCKKRGIPILLYNASVGPVRLPAAVKALQRVMDASVLAILRDRQSEELFQSLDLQYPEVIINADCALNTVPPSDQRIDTIIQKEGLFRNPKGTIGFNINSYIKWTKDGVLQRNDFVKIIGEVLNNLIEKLDVDIMYAVTQIMDYTITRESLKYVKKPHRVKVIGNADYTYQEITGLLKKVEVHAGLRTHTLIFSAAVNTPMVCISSYPKSVGFMQSIKQDDWVVGVNDLSVANLSDLIIKAWHNREETRTALKSIVPQEKIKARQSAEIISRLL
ncbi:polysaccharide pyruvyl transferase family protein [Desulfococcaceae bacterium HSG9]|nr:polysaccharide pyruvyl transferase family protein [Desulfococcaceae bacterium HSG9]